MEQPSYYPKWKTRTHWPSVDSHFYVRAMCVWLVIFPTKPANTSSLDGYDYAARWLLNRHDDKLLILHWRSPLSIFQRPTNSHWVLNKGKQNAYSLSWQPVYRFYEVSFESEIFEKSLFVSDHHTHHLHDSWCRSIAFQFFRPGIYNITLHVLGSVIYGLTSSAFLLQLILRNFHNLP